jgi:hypothetical protein
MDIGETERKEGREQDEDRRGRKRDKGYEVGERKERTKK